MTVKLIHRFALILCIVLCSGCTSVPVYKREKLAKPEMSWEPDAMASSLKQHIYFSKEGSSGGGKAAGGGCGCN